MKHSSIKIFKAGTEPYPMIEDPEALDFLLVIKGTLHAEYNETD